MRTLTLRWSGAVSRGRSPRSLVALLLSLACVAAPGAHAEARQDASQGEALLASATRLFDALDYEAAVPELDRAIAALQAASTEDGPARAAFLRALELRARARFGLGDADGSSGDFRMLLELEPGFTFNTQVSPRVVALLDGVRKTTVGALMLSIQPGDAVLDLNGRRLPLTGAPVQVRAGDHALTVSRVGYRPMDMRVSVKPGATTDLTVSLERIAAAVFLVTSPPDVEVTIDGLSRGRTEAGSLLAEYATLPERLGVSPSDVSRPLVLTELGPGVHELTFSRDCYVTERGQITIEQLADYRIEPVKLQPAVATLSVDSVPSGANVFVDGTLRGVSPITLSDVCAGTRTVEVRSPHGRASREVTLEAGLTASVSEEVKPTFALLPSAEPPAPGLPDNRTRVEGVLSRSRRVGLYSPTGAELERLMEGQPLPAEWLAFDASGQPIGGASAFSAAARRDLSARLAKALDVQGVAAVSQPTAASSELVVSLLAAGAGHPDVIPVVAERVDSVNEALERFDYLPRLFRHEIGAVAIEVLDLPGLLVAAVEANSPASRAGLAPGEVIVKADEKPLATAADLERALEAKQAGEQLALEVRDGKGAVRSVKVALVTTPRLVSVSDRTLLFNSLAVALRSRLAAAHPNEQPFIRLNLAVALMRLGDFAGARDLLSAVQLAPGSGISQGTQHYLLGLAHEGLGDMAAAEQAWRAAESAGGTLTDEGPPIASLARQKLTRKP